MIVDSRQIQYFKSIASTQYVSLILSDYGEDKRESLVLMTDIIAEIYKHLRYNTFERVIIYTAFDTKMQLSQISSSSYSIVKSYENLTPIAGKDIVIEIKTNGELHLSIDNPIDLETLRINSIVYHFDKANEIEIFYGKSRAVTLKQIPDADSYFSVQTYKDLDLALEDYGTKVARKSDCVYLKGVWSTQNRIFFKPKPEHILRDSLTQFLKFRLRNVEVRPEQIVDKSHPVDIKITWSLASHLALIEIKWLGKSSPGVGQRFKQIYTRQRALDGAKQLAEYLDANSVQAPAKSTKGYLVIFDGRRWGCSKNDTIINRQNGIRYANDQIIFMPQYHIDRSDFARPIKFFLEPEMTA